MGIVNAGKKFINAVKNAAKKVMKFVKFMISPLGTILGWILLIIFIVLLIAMIIQVLAVKIQELVGINWNYSTYDEDLQVVKDLYNSGYESMLDAENFQDFKSFEYAVLMDAAEYIRISKQERFDIYENEGEYKYERERLMDKLPEEYKKALERIEKEYASDPSKAAVTLLDVSYDTNQSKLSDDKLKECIEESFSSRNVEVGGISEAGSIKGGTNRAVGPFLVYEFKAGEYHSGDTSGDKKVPENSGDYSGEASDASADGSVDQLLSSGDMKGSLEPFIYVIKEDIKFLYYFDEDNNVIEYPLILNAFNAKLNVGTENSNELNRALLGIAPVVWPDDDKEKYTQTPYYNNETENVIYKIPLRTILGRYMPKSELLNAWAVLKQDIDKGENTEQTDIIDDILASIKGVYNEACLLNENPTTIKEDKEIIEEKEDGTEEKKIETYYYSNDDTHSTSFVKFQKAGIETTKYDIDGLKPLSSGEADIKLVTDLIDAVIVEPEITVEYEVYENDKVIETATKTFSLEELNVSSYVKKGKVIRAYGSEEDGYSPPSSLDGEDAWWCAGGKDKVDEIKSKIRDAVTAKVLNEYNSTVKTIDPNNFGVRVNIIGDEAVMYNPIFTTKDASVAKELKIEHTRMPVLLVSEATTWCRKISYTHSITQNQFKQNNKYYIIPKSVSSIGLKDFKTTVNQDSYRGKAYKDIFARMKEKDVIDMILQLETGGKEGSSDCYEYIRDLYKLVQASKEYSINHPSEDPNKNIHENTYSYIYIPDSVLYFEDSQSQKMYWLDLFAAKSDGDAITKDELENFRTKDKDITWQVIDYANYNECKSIVYALNPFGSAYVRAYFQAQYENGDDVSGNFDLGSHNGADWTGRAKINAIKEKGNSAEDVNGISEKIYNYEINRLSKIYPLQSDAVKKLTKNLEEELSYMPIVAVAPGYVSRVAYSSRSGFYVTVKHSEEEGIETMYMHLKRWPLVNEGDYVGAGTYLGYEGNTGRSFGKHLHFQVMKNGTPQSPSEYIFPVFTPFFNKEKAEEKNYDLASEYLTLYRTVSMNNPETLINQKPSQPLVNNVSNLIQRQGEITLGGDGRAFSMSGEYGWNDKDVEDYPKYLADNHIYDLYNEPAFFDKELAREQGYLQIPSELLNYLFDSIIVKTDMPGALPALTREELVYILEHWLPARYGDAVYDCPKNDPKNNGMKKVDWLMKYVFTDETIDKIIEAQSEYKVSAVFMLAVATQEQQMGLSDTIIAKTETCNIFSIRYSNKEKARNDPENATRMDQTRDGKKVECYWRRYGTYANAFYQFSGLIGERGPYFKEGRYTIGQIAPVYCEGNTWGRAVAKICLEIMQYYTGNGWSFADVGSLWFGSNAELINAAKNCFAYASAHKFAYCQHGCPHSVPLYKGEPVNGDFSKLPTRHEPKLCKHDGSGYGIFSCKIDCSSYVSWVLYEYAKANGLEEFASLAAKSAQSGFYRDVGRYLYNGQIKEKDKEHIKSFAQYFQLVWMKGRPGDNYSTLKENIQPGDILATIDSKGQGHVEIYVGAENDTEPYPGRYSSSNSKGCVIYSCGLYKKRSIPDITQKAMSCVIRPMPANMVP